MKVEYCLHNKYYGEKYWFELSLAYAREGHFARAIKSIRQALAFNPQGQYLYQHLAHYHLELGNANLAKAVLAQGERVKLIPFSLV